MVLGTWSRHDTLYGGEGYSITGSGDLKDKLNEAIQKLPAFAPQEPSTTPEEPKVSFTSPPSLHVGEGSFFVAENRTICQSICGESVVVRYGGRTLTSFGTRTGKRMAALVTLRDQARRVLQSQNEGWPEPHRNDARRDLNWAYDNFAATFGPINKTTFGQTKAGHLIRRMPNLVKFREDPDAMLVMSLEDYDETTGKATKAAIMKKDVVGRSPPILQVETAEEGLLVSLNQKGVVDLAFIEELYGKPKEQVTAELGDLIFYNPENLPGRRPTITCPETSGKNSCLLKLQGLLSLETWRP